LSYAPTTEARAFNNPINEGAGIVTSDSLAAESMQNSGSFAAGNPKAGVHGQSSAGTTANNQDTSGAKILGAAPDADAREATEGWSETAQLNAGAGLGKAAGKGPTYATPSESNTSSGKAYNTTTGSGSNGHLKPKGKNLTEGGFDSDAPNASFNSEIGSKNDPGRVAEAEIQRRQAESGPDAGSGPRQSGVTGEHPYSALDNETSA
ncbi:hypothetical protein K490DRAFT_41952, partial [Saccharata proteae CBS 121410]